MRFSFTGRHMEIGQSLTEKAQSFYQGLELKYEIQFIDVSIVMRKENSMFYADISVKMNNRVSFHSNGTADCPITSFTLAAEKTEQQIQKRKKTCRCAKEGCCEINNFDNSLEEDGPLIIAELMDDLPLLSVSEAASKITADKPLFVFENIASNAVNVVYIRKDNNVGWIDYHNKK